MIADRIKALREQANLTQADLSRILGITRSSINAWEQGISVPSTQYIIELSRLFHVSTDVLLSIDNYAHISVDGLSEEDIILVQKVVEHLRRKNQNHNEQ